MKIINVGVYPPPFGGVSNHLKRLLEFLQKSNINSILIDTSNIPKSHPGVININRKLVLFYLIFHRKSIVHFHGFDLKTLFLIYLVSYRHITILSLHNEWFLDQMKAQGSFLYKVSVFLFRRIKKVLLPTAKCKETAESFIKDSKKLHVIPAFIPPTNIPELELENIMKIRKEHKFLISTNAFQIDFYKGIDIYGFDILIEMMNRLCNEMKLDIVLVFLLPNIGNQDYFKKLKQQIDKYSLGERFIFITKPIKESSSLWIISDLVIRATNTDGNSLTVLEALSLGIPVIASDCVERPEGVILFKNRDLFDITKKVNETLANLNEYKRAIRNIKIENNANKILNIYSDLSKEIFR